MSAICKCLMKVKGEKKDLKKFLKKLDVNNPKIGRGLNYKIKEINEKTYEEGLFDELEDDLMVLLKGECKNSINSSLFLAAEKAKRKGDINQLTLLEASRNYDLDIEVFSENKELEFQEHYLIYNGKLKDGKVVHWLIVPLERNDTKESLERENGIKISDEEWIDALDSGFLNHGGFKNKKFSF